MRLRPTVAEVDLDAIRHNVRKLKPEGTELMGVVKANGYGHGAVPVARTALGAGATWLGVALVEEGIELRGAGIEAPILLLSEIPRGAEKEALSAGLTPTVYTGEGLEALTAAARDSGDGVRVHVKVDTGMHRVGLAPQEALPFCRRVTEGLELEGLWTHLAKADVPGDPSVPAQLARYTEALAALEAGGIRPRYRHAANSAATLAHPEAHFDLVRVGIAMYGLAPSPEMGRGERLPAMSLRSRVSMVKRLAAGESISYGLRYRLGRDSTIATVPIGYADGYVRSLSESGRVLVRGRRYPIAGTVTMDQIMVDVGDDPVEPGDEVVLFGRQDGEEITADEVAGWLGTIAYEVACGVGPRVPRSYAGEGSPGDGFVWKQGDVEILGEA